MKTSILILSIVLLIFWSCEEKKDDESVDTNPPSVLITSPNNNSIVNDTLVVACESIDNDEVVKVELWINSDSTGITDSTAPYTLTWITNNYENGEHTLFVRSYDKSGNSRVNEILFLFDNGYSRISCFDWSDKITKEKGWTDHLRVSVGLKEFGEFLKISFK